MIIAVDFDGTIVEHRFPEIGRPVVGLFAWMKAWQEAGARLILFTMRSDRKDAGKVSYEGHEANRDYLAEAVEFCRVNGVEFWAVNQNPEQHTWTDSPKPYAHVYVDDAAFGCPLSEGMGQRPSVDWSQVGPAVLGLLQKRATA